MRTTRPCRDAASPADEPSAARVSLRAMYADAMKQVMADPHKAIAEHEPWLAALLPPAGADGAGP